MPKTVFRTKITMVKEDFSKSFFESTTGIENAKADWQSQGKILGYHGTNSESDNQRVYICDFIDEDTRNLFRVIPEVASGMQALMVHNSNNNIVTYYDEQNVETSDYD